ncbi:MAG: carboxylesterase family protein, partial [Sphingopyxis sp.]
MMGNDRNAPVRGHEWGRRAVIGALAAAPALALPALVPGGAAWAAGRRANPVATTRYGRVRGFVADGVLCFRGVRYGADTAARRFASAAPPAPWHHVANATEYGPSAPQTGTSEPTSEDCLFLNIWTPALDGARRPVMVYLHGGAHSHGSGSDPLYDGGALVRRGDVVV